MKRTKVRCPICNKLRITRSVHFRCCNKQHNTSENLASKVEIEPKIEKPGKAVEPGQISEDLTKKVSSTEKNSTNQKDLETPNNVTITYKDAKTGEVLLKSGNCVIFEGTWKGEDRPKKVEMEVDRFATKDNPNSSISDSKDVVESNPSPESKEPILENKIVQGLAVAAAGVGFSYWLNNRKGKSNSETDW